ncbi:hypothetical protein [Clostridium oceanicum]|uniref:Uncharacterized protein n=1 Tax=Clostridium oceanicum TaxID=1543 RepID=A0ABP3UY29_9CLOT
MLRIPISVVIFRTIPEALFLILSIYLLFGINIKENKKKILVSTIILGFSIYIIRLLPIHFGVHTILFTSVYIVLIATINKIEINRAIISCVFIIILSFLLEYINVYILSFFFKDSIVSMRILKDKLLISILCYPSLIIFFITMVFISKINRKKDILKIFSDK